MRSTELERRAKIDLMTDTAQSPPRPIPERYRLNYEDYCTFPDDGKRYEIIEGELFVSPLPTINHQRLSKRLQRLLEENLERTGKGEVFNAPFDVILSDISICQPDIIVFLVDHGGRLSKRGMEGAPPLVVEILSPSTQKTDRDRKSKLYAASGVIEYWILDPDAEQLEIHRLQDESAKVARFVGESKISSELAGELTGTVSDMFEPPKWEKSR